MQNGGVEENLTVLRAYFEMPLGATKDVLRVTGLPYRVVHQAENALENANMLASDKLGWGCRAISRRYLPPEGLRALEITGPTWHDEGNRCLLLGRLPLVQAFYSLAGRVLGIGQFTSFQWITESGFDAVAHYENGWIALLWSGPMEKESVLGARVQGLWRDFSVLAATEISPWPAKLCFVVYDQWQQVLVERVLRKAGLPPANWDIWCLANGACPDVMVEPESRGLIYQPVSRRGTGAWPWERRVEAFPWATGQVTIANLMDDLAQWSKLDPKWMRRAYGEGENNRTIYRTLEKMEQLKLATKSGGRKSSIYSPTNRTYNILSLRDGVNHSWVEANQGPTRIDRHDALERKGMLEFRVGGCPIARGTRNTEEIGKEDMGKKGGGIAPDAMAYLGESPYGPGWANVEVELSAIGETRIKKKLGGPASRRLRQDNHYTLAVCKNDRAEEAFQTVGRRLRIQLLTTTVARLQRHGPLDNYNCWSRYGEFVRLSAPQQPEEEEPGDLEC